MRPFRGQLRAGVEIHNFVKIADLICPGALLLPLSLNQILSSGDRRAVRGDLVVQGAEDLSHPLLLAKADIWKLESFRRSDVEVLVDSPYRVCRDRVPCCRVHEVAKPAGIQFRARSHHNQICTIRMLNRVRNHCSSSRLTRAHNYYITRGKRRLPNRLVEVGINELQIRKINCVWCHILAAQKGNARITVVRRHSANETHGHVREVCKLLHPSLPSCSRTTASSRADSSSAAVSSPVRRAIFSSIGSSSSSASGTPTKRPGVSA